MKTQILQTAKTIILALILTLGMSYVMAWTGPTTTPPNGNTPTPINIGTTDQIKDGGLGVNSIYATGTIRADGGFQVDGTQIISGTGSIGGDFITDGTIDSTEIEDNSLTASDLAANSVGTSEVQDNSLTATDLAANSVGDSEMIDNPNFTTVTTSSYSKASGGMRASSYCDINGANCKTTSEMGGGADTNAITLCPNDQFLDGDGTCLTATQIVNNGGGGGAMLYKCPAHPGLGSYDFRSICKDPFIFDDSRCAGQVTTSSSCAEYFITSTSYYDSSQSYCDKRTITCSPL